MGRIRMEGVGVTYRVHLDRITSLKEWTVRKLQFSKTDKGKIKEIHALEGISLELQDGDRFGVVGLNGAGKSTLLKTLAQILVPTEGRVEIEGRVQPLLEIGAGFEGEFTGRENIYYNGAMLGFSRKEIQDHEKQIIDYSGIEEFIDVPIKCYSSGMVSRLAFSVAMMIKPEILLMDEMISAGDGLFLAKARDTVFDVISKTRILVMATHEIGLLESLCNKGMVLDRGRCVFSGTGKDVAEYYQANILKG